VARLTLLARAGEILAASLDDRQTLQRLATLTVPGLATWCAIDMLCADGSIRRSAEANGGDPRDGFPLDHNAPHGAAIVLRTGEPELVAKVADRHLRARGVVSYLCVPLVTREGAAGAMTLISGDPARLYGPADLELAAELGRRAAAAVENSRLYRSLERSEERYRLLFEQNPLPMWVYDADTLRFLAVNDAAVRHYGWTRHEFLGMRITDIRPQEDVERLLSSIASEGPGSPLPNHWRHRRKDGSVIDVEITAGRVTFEGQDAALVLAHDVTERRQLEERLLQGEKMEAIGRLAGGVAHDFNNLITVISGYASILLARAEPSEREELAEIAHAAEQASSLTRQLLAFSRRQVLRPRVLDLNEIVAGMEPMLHRIIGADISIGVRLAAELPAVEADHAEIERVILNLAANARDAMPTGGRLTIETANVELDEEYVSAHGEGTVGPNVLLAVSDTGHGMSEEVRERLFEPFFTTKRPGAGTGFGLATVFGVVKQSGGSIFVYSEEGRGTTFKIYLPAADPGRGIEEEPAAEPVAARGDETVLVVEDDASVRELVCAMLQANGYRVLSVEDPRQALSACLEHGGVDLLLTDVIMPEMNGAELAEKLAEVAPSLRILFMSGYSDEAVTRHGVLRPDAAFVEKPFTERVLARKVREVLDAG
jgi:PAS domain S-box-containing protein